MALTGWPFMLLLGVVGLLCAVGAYLGWPRWPGRWALPGRAASLLLVMMLGGVLALAQVNRSYGFYTSVSDLLGRPTSARSLAMPAYPGGGPQVTVLTSDWAALGLRAGRHGHGLLLDVLYPGTRSGLTHHGLLYLPAAYFTGNLQRRFAAVELFHGYPGAPETFPRIMNIQARLETEIAAGRVPPVVLVIPQVYAGGHSSECVNAVHGEQWETYLSVDVLDDVTRTFRVYASRSWATLGISTGGFCAANVALHHPERYAAAASISGYFTAGQDPGTPGLYQGSRFASRENSPIWWVRYRAPVAPALFLSASGGDILAMNEARAMTATLRHYAPSLPTTTMLTASGGHNWGVFSAAFGPAIDWAAEFLPGPLVVPPVNPS
ncbi:alpha/beta hydrolase [Pseudofrankia inefficax]|uniref:Esterase n=1 Tax=Pseudofrankia inefficax (strain DSM 45817 / CECT 9037 / DDB 130130 / EuI1c) TaxID=298654 RepID=E3J945_PSEI1|nr:alpha/beta hydrolase-fold protein [Pseudofrankia inefficax]ADP80924.1 esterase [Pseudofrankia inefficax]